MPVFDENENSLLGRHPENNHHDDSILSNSKLSPIHRRNTREKTPVYEIPPELDNRRGDFIGGVLTKTPDMNTQQNGTGLHHDNMSNGQGRSSIQYHHQAQNNSFSKHQTNTPEKRSFPHRKRPTPSGNKYHYAGGTNNGSLIGQQKTNRNSDVSMRRNNAPAEESRMSNASHIQGTGAAPANSFLVAAPPSRLKQTIAQLRYELERCQRQLDYEVNDKSQLKIQIQERNDEVELLRKQVEDYRDFRQLYDTSDLQSMRGSILEKTKQDLYTLQREYNTVSGRMSTLTDELASLKNDFAAKDSQLSRVLMENREADSLLSTRSSRIQKLEQENAQLKAHIKHLESNENQLNQQSSLEMHQFKNQIQDLQNMLEIEQTNCKKFEKKFEDTKTDIRILMEQKNKLQSELETRDMNIQNLQQEIMDLKNIRERNYEDTYHQQLDEQKARYQSKINSIHEEYEQKIARMTSDQQRELDHWRRLLSDSQDKLSQVQESLRQYESRKSMDISTQTVGAVYTDEHLQKQIKRYTSSLEEDLDGALADKSHLKEHNTYLESQIKEMQLKIDLITRERDEKERKYLEFENKIQHIEEHTKKVEHSFRMRSEQVRELEHELENVSKQLQEKKLESNDVITKLETEIRNLKQSVNVGELELKERDRTIRHLQQNVKESQNAVLDDQRMEQLRRHYTNLLKQRDEELDILRQAHRDELNQVRRQIESQKDDLRDRFTNQKNGNSRKLSETEARMEELQVELRQVRQDYELLNIKLSEKDARISKLMDHKEKFESHYRQTKMRLTQNLERAQEELQRHQLMMQRQADQIKSLERQNELLQGRAMRKSSFGGARSSLHVDP